MSTHQLVEALASPDLSGYDAAQQPSPIDLEGLEHVFKWASDVVADGEDSRVRIAREKRVRRQVLEIVQKARDERMLRHSKDEASYLQRRVIALLQKLQEVTEESATARSIMISQYYMLQQIPVLENEVKRLRNLELEKEAAVTERRYLMDALARLKSERDMLDELVATAEEENARVANLLAEARQELQILKNRRWWHCFFPPALRSVVFNPNF